MIIIIIIIIIIIKCESGLKYVASCKTPPGAAGIPGAGNAETQFNIYTFKNNSDCRVFSAIWFFFMFPGATNCQWHVFRTSEVDMTSVPSWLPTQYLFFIICFFQLLKVYLMKPRKLLYCISCNFPSNYFAKHKNITLWSPVAMKHKIFSFINIKGNLKT